MNVKKQSGKNTTKNVPAQIYDEAVTIHNQVQALANTHMSSQKIADILCTNSLLSIPTKKENQDESGHEKRERAGMGGYFIEMEGDFCDTLLEIFIGLVRGDNPYISFNTYRNTVFFKNIMLSVEYLKNPACISYLWKYEVLTIDIYSNEIICTILKIIEIQLEETHIDNRSSEYENFKEKISYMKRILEEKGGINR